MTASVSRRARGAALGAALALAPLGVAAAQQPSSGTMGNMPGMDHSKMQMDRPAPRDSNQAFLRMMSDHHQGLIQMADTAKGRAAKPVTRQDAQKLDAKQHREQHVMLDMLKSQYSDNAMPMVMPSNQAMLDTLTRASGAAFDPTFYRLVAQHHQEAIAMTDKMLPSLTGRVREMATKMRADQQREIPEMQRKMTRAEGKTASGR